MFENILMKTFDEQSEICIVALCSCFSTEMKCVLDKLVSPYRQDIITIKPDKY